MILEINYFPFVTLSNKNNNVQKCFCEIWYECTYFKSSIPENLKEGDVMADIKYILIKYVKCSPRD